MIELENKFHNTSIKVRAQEYNNYYYCISARVYRRADKELCGMSDCCCGGVDRNNTFYPCVDENQKVVLYKFSK